MIKSALNPAIAAALAATTTLCLAAPTLARAETVTISTAGIDLASVEGQRQLDHRIQYAARAVCGVNEVSTGTRLHSPDAGKCYSQALRDARARFADLVTTRATAG